MLNPVYEFSNAITIMLVGGIPFTRNNVRIKQFVRDIAMIAAVLYDVIRDETACKAL